MSDKFYSDRQKHVVLKSRAPLPPNPQTRVINTGLLTTLGLYSNTVEVGTVSYYLGNVNSLGMPWLATNKPELYQSVVISDGGPAPLPRLMIIVGFYSHYEHTVKGIGSTMLREVLKVAEMAECTYIVVASGINPEVYPALGFERIDDVDTWCMPVSGMKARLSPLRRFREAP